MRIAESLGGFAISSTRDLAAWRLRENSEARACRVSCGDPVNPCTGISGAADPMPATRTSLSLIFASALTCLSVARGDLTYVDATPGAGGNTTLADGSTFTPPLNGTNGADQQWEQRTVFGSGGNIYESGGEGAEITVYPSLKLGLYPLFGKEQWGSFQRTSETDTSPG